MLECLEKKCTKKYKKTLKIGWIRTSHWEVNSISMCRIMSAFSVRHLLASCGNCKVSVYASYGYIVGLKACNRTFWLQRHLKCYQESQANNISVCVFFHRFGSEEVLFVCSVSNKLFFTVVSKQKLLEKISWKYFEKKKIDCEFGGLHTVNIVI